MAEDRQFPEWEQLYKDQPIDTMPWYYPALDPDLESALKRHELASGAALDIGTGPGTQAIALAGLGYRVTATDLSESAVLKADANAREKGLVLDFKADDILHTRLEGPFDFALDRGCFHVFPPEARAEYARIVAGLLRPAGHLFLKTFSELQPGEGGPYKFSPDAIRAIFGGYFKVLSSDETVYQGTRDPLPKALFSVLERI